MKYENEKYYEKALILYNKGYIDKAIEVCETGISNSLKDSKLLNLKGLLLYIKGNLEEATAIWKINKDYNNDLISKSYLEDSKSDFQRYVLYKEAESLIENMYIDEALENLLECSNSDFNAIEVNTLLAIAYIKKGQYDNSKLCLEKVLSFDKKNMKANEILKDINELLDTKNISRLLIGSISVISVLLIVLVTVYSLGILDINLNGSDTKGIIVFKKEENKKNDEVNNIEENNLSKDEANNVQDSSLNKDEEFNSELVSNEHILLTNIEIQNNYEEASIYFKEKNYESVINILEETKEASSNHYLNDDIIFFLASSYDKLGDSEKAIEVFEDFISMYKQENYSQEVYYRLILLYSEKDINKSKEYAKEFIEIYPSSIYNNNKVKEILNL